MRRRSSTSGPAKSRRHTIKRKAQKASIKHQSRVEPLGGLDLQTGERDLSLDRFDRNHISSETTASRSVAANGSSTLGAEAAEHERQFRELLEFCPAALLVVDEDGRLLSTTHSCAKY
jgi:hypothetical protein